ncbi:Uncharacterised protein [Slackia heliotrinireducens]|uniref:Uncharacterized protein n=1 Tax=Slackia heliotrinireducens (strain ATCC 29202 / DSM 20476 / NCTC 11029 / RHS 1) TaxID=471855 RepID=C7N248_SLAHD|nr:hypothetical protein [Slackia heliotrinireducens]ACV21354.1 hypothetical protein Shel_02860 [Slackia heliotrinireducens DSM 20476]VEG98788.1 Uncharacterised protein [Slackia heliotrinireducens]
MDDSTFCDSVFQSCEIDGGGPIKSRSHLTNHIGYLLRHNNGVSYLNEFTEYNLAAIHSETGWSIVSNWEDEPVRNDTYQTILKYAWNATRWEILWLFPDDQTVPEELIPNSTLEGRMDLLREAAAEWAISLKDELFFNHTVCLVLHLDEDRPHVHRLVVPKFCASKSSIAMPTNSPDYARTKHDDSHAWQLFARGIPKNEYVKQWLIKRDNNKCACCGKPLRKSAVVNHIDYDHECEFDGMQLLHRPGIPDTIPDCELCHEEQPELF